MKALLAFLLRHQRNICIVLGIFIVVTLALRQIPVYRNAFYGDLKVMLSTSKLIAEHTSPYMTPAYQELGYPAPPVQPPSISILLMPFTFLPLLLVEHATLALTFLAALGCILLVVIRYRLYRGNSLLTPCYENLLVWSIIFLAAVSGPVLNMLRYGQLVSFAWLCMLFALLYPGNRRSNVVLLALAAGIKYSLLPLTAPLLLLQKRWGTCACGFILFAILALLPGLWLGGIIPGITEYLRMLVDDMGSGVNSYANGTNYNMVQFDFLRFPIVNLLGKSLVLGLVLLTIIRVWKTRSTEQDRRFPLELTPAEFGLFTSATLCLSYHRIHDALIMIPFLAAVCIQGFQRKRYKEFTVSMLFLLYMAVPLSQDYQISSLIGRKLPVLEKFVYFGSHPPWDTIFPLSNIAIFCLTLWFFYLAWNENRNELRIPMKTILVFLRRHQRTICIAIGILLILALAGRQLQVFRGAGFVDLDVIMTTSSLIADNTSPYMTEAYRAYNYPAPPIQAPSVSILVMPLLILPEFARAVVVFNLTLLAAVGCVLVVMNRYKLFRGSSIFTPCYPNLGMWFITFLAVTSGPVLTMLRHGQLVSIAWLCILLVLLYPRRDKVNWLFLGLSAGIKYSLLPLAAPLLLLQRRWLICAAGFLLFGILVLMPGLWLGGIVSSISEYVKMLLEDVSGGANAYATGSSYNMIHFDFFRSGFLNLLGKAAVLFMLALVIVRTWRRRHEKSGWFPLEITAAELGLVSAATLSISYHRIYDVTIVMPFLAAVCVRSLFERRHAVLTVSLLFLVYLAMPTSADYLISDRIGQALPFLEKIVYFSGYGQWKKIVPLTNIAIFALTAWFFYLAWTEDSRPKRVAKTR